MRLCPCSDSRRPAPVNVTAWHETQGGIPRIPRPPHASIAHHRQLLPPPYSSGPISPVAFPSPSHSNQSPPKPPHPLTAAIAQCQGAREWIPLPCQLSSGRQRGTAQGPHLPRNPATPATSSTLFVCQRHINWVCYRIPGNLCLLVLLWSLLVLHGTVTLRKLECGLLRTV